MLNDIIAIVPVLIVVLAGCAILLAEAFRRPGEWMPMGWLGRRVHHASMPSLRPALVWLFALLGFAASAVICLPTFGAPQTAIVSVAASAIGAWVVTLIEIVVGAVHS